MRFWTREIAGWLLVMLGLLGFYLCIVWLSTPHILESGLLTFIAFMVFRGGIHLIKVAVAARICQQAQDRLLQERIPPAPPSSVGRVGRRSSVDSWRR